MTAGSAMEEEIKGQPSRRPSREASPDVTLEKSSSTLPLHSSGSLRPSNFKVLGKLGFVPGWEGLRGLAVSMVMYSHVALHKEMIGTMGVGIFFVLSGFLITGVLVSLIEKYDQARQQASGTSEKVSLGERLSYLPRFYLDRFVRLTPAMALMVVIVTYQCRFYPTIRADAFAAFFYVHNFLPKQVDEPRLMFPGMFEHTWSLAVEEQFYIFWSLVIAFIVPLSQRRRAMALGALISVSFFVRHYSGYAFLSDHMYGIDYRYAYTANAFKMFIGCAGRLLPMPTLWTKKWFGFVSTVTLLLGVYFWGWTLISWGYDYRTEGAWLELWTSILVLMVVIGSVNGNVILESQILRFPGRISYSWYLWQFPCHAMVGWPANNYGPTGLAFAIATFTTFVIEEPIRNRYHVWRNARAASQEDKPHTRRQE
ncbi:Acyltransferase 3 [Kalmanozyma brasiliensis GHG001]|uniref:Acyltransferase 3 domain-containing protein n=1 Tax=Kalmanozyma brasiliensis (strain GHG001) TaxID=1365824 RepID=V5ESH8_KALBG|nr:Acyltransferase 3 [Kalmanozyma brasiliensis GHG001]EST08100.1 Acyltransferase 3 [Kalmanozyma brasiliensis GHG001]